MLGNVEAMRQILTAQSVAIVGASNNPGKWGYALFDTIRRSGYEGALYPINLKASEVQGIRAYPSLDKVPGPVDLAVILVPAAHVPGTLRQAAAKGVPVAAVLSAGFRESGRSDLEAELAQAAREAGVRVLGPNIQGVSYLPNKLCAMFWPAMTSPGLPAKAGELMITASVTVITPRPMRVIELEVHIFTWWGVA